MASEAAVVALLLKFAISPVIAVVSVIAYPARLPGQV